jgi:PAS domain S-box-containing protein
MALLTTAAFMLLSLRLLGGGTVTSGLNSLTRSSSSSTDRPLPAFPWFLLILLVVLPTAIGATGCFVISRQLVDSRHRIEDELVAVAELKIGQIAHWREERLADANAVLDSCDIADDLREFLANPADIRAKNRVLDAMAALTKHNRYARVLLLDANQQVRFSVPTDKGWLGSIAKSFVARAMRGNQVLVSDLHISSVVPGYVNMDLFVPLLPSPDGSGAARKPIGVLLFEIDPADYLFPLIQSWPTPSLTAETLLVRRDGDSVLFLNELRHQAGTALRLRLPMDRLSLPAAMAVLGQEHVVAGLDYRNVPVLAAMHPIPDSPWFMVAKVDQEEVYAPIRRQLLTSGALFGVLLLATMFGVALLWRQRDTAFLRQSLAHEEQREALATRIAYLTKHANDIIVLADEEWRILDANDRAIETYGRTLAELQQMTLRDLHTGDGREAFDRQTRSADATKGAVFETTHQRRDGSLFPVESSLRAVDMAGTTYYQFIIRDITERKRAEVSLAESESRLNAILRGLPIPCFVIDGNHRVTHWNRAIENYSGVKTQDAIGTNQHWRAFYPAERPCMADLQVDGMQDRIPEWYAGKCAPSTLVENTYEATDFFPHMGDHGVWLWFTCAPITDADGKVIAAIETMIDVTDRTQAEEALRESEKRYRTLFESAAEGILIADAETQQFRHANAAMCRMLGYSENELKRMSIPDIHPKDDVPHVLSLFERMVTQGLSSAQALPCLRKDGTTIYADLSISSIVIDGRSCLVALFDDVTDRKRAEESLRQSQKRLRNLIDGVSPNMFIALLTPDGTLLETNRPSLEVAGLKLEDLLGTPFEENYWWNYSEEVKRQLHAAIERAARGEPSRYDVQIRVAENEFAVLDFSLQPLRDETGEIVFLVPSANVITERKQAEESLRRAHDELERRVEERTAQLAAKNEELKGFAYTVSHDLKAPLRGIAGYASELERKHRTGLGDRAQFCVNQILTATHSLDDLIEDLLHYSRLDAETPSDTDVSLCNMVEAILKDRSPLIAKQHTEVTVDVPAGTLRTWERGLTEVLTNLIDNALKYSRNAAPPRLIIHAGELDQNWRIAVSDNGIGFDMKYHDRIFGLFNRLVREDEFEGTGAGLAIVKKMVDKQGGRVWAESAPNQGATFFVEIPNRTAATTAGKPALAGILVAKGATQPLSSSSQPSWR